MPDFLVKKYKVRKATSKGGHEVSLPPAWIEHREQINPAGGEQVEVLYDSIIVIVPPGVRVNKRALAKAVKVIKIEEQDN